MRHQSSGTRCFVTRYILPEVNNASLCGENHKRFLVYPNPLKKSGKLLIDNDFLAFQISCFRVAKSLKSVKTCATKAFQDRKYREISRLHNEDSGARLVTRGLEFAFDKTRGADSYKHIDGTKVQK